ncbi:ATP-binding protein [Thermocladium modestius]|uniref:ATP-binding protein n=1 Tax=Thermocladium modestius TaxID=62609 RepID=UPI001E5A29A3|nr:ATP-binding protein [Thermocladium modestius]
MNYLGVIYEVDGVRGAKMRVFSDAEDGIWMGKFVVIDDAYPVLSRVISIDRRNYLSDERMIAQLDSKERMDELRKYGFDLEYISTSTTASLSIIGKFGGNGLLHIDRPIKPYSLVYDADDKLIEALLGAGGDSSLDVGVIKGSRVHARLDPDKLVTHHCAILASTGAGKSWLAGVILEELTLKVGLPILVIDPHGEYSAMQYQAEQDRASKEEAEAGERVSSLVSIYIPGKVDVSSMDRHYAKRFGRPRRYVRVGMNPRSMPLGILVRLLNYYYGLTDAQRRILEEGWVYNSVYEEPPLTPIDDLIKEIVETGKSAATKGYGGEIATSSLMTKLRMLFENRPFFITRYGDYYGSEPIRLLDVRGMLSTPGIKVLDLSSLDVMDQQALTAVVLDEVFSLAKRRSIPPTFLLIEEAHNFVPSKGSAMSKQPILRIAREGRKFGIGMCLVSQRPSRVDPDALSQCMTQIFKRIINPLDLKYVELISEYVSREEVGQLRVLNSDEALVTGLSVKIPLLIGVRRRFTAHGGETPSIEESLKDFLEGKQGS